MADTFQDIQKEQLDSEVQYLIDKALKAVQPEQIKTNVKDSIESSPQGIDRIGTLPDDQQQYVRSLPQKDKDDVLRYLDIFQQDNSEVIQYIDDLRKFGYKEKTRKEGSSKIHNINKFAREIVKNPEVEEDANRLLTYLVQGEDAYDISTRSDTIGVQKQKKYKGTKTYKITAGMQNALESSLREAAITATAIYDAVGDKTDAVSYLEKVWPETEKSREGLEKLSEDLTQFGLSLYAGKKIIGLFGRGFKLVAPKTYSKILERVNRTKPKLDKKGKPIVDQYGRIQTTSNIAQKLGYWGVGSGIAYGVGESILRGGDDKTILGDTFGIAESLKIENTKGLTDKEKAVEILKNKLKFGADGTAFIGGLNIGFRVAAPVVKGAAKAIGVPLKFAGQAVLNPLSKVAASRLSGIPQTVGGIRKGIDYVTTKSGIPPMDRWQFFDVSAGPFKERLLKVIDASILTPLRTRAKLTPEAAGILRRGEALVKRYQKEADLSLKEIERRLYKLLDISFKDRVFTSSTNVAARQYFDDLLLYLQNKATDKALPEVIRTPAKDIRNLIDRLTTKLKPFIKDQDIKEEFISNIGKYLRNSYNIFRGNFKPNKKSIDEATEYFKNLIKNTDKQFKGKLTPEKTALLNRLASQKVSEILQVAQEGTSPRQRLAAITGIVTPIKNLIKKNETLPDVIKNLLGKVDDPRTVIIDTVTQQANLLAHLYTQKALVRNGLKNNWVFRSQEDFAKLGIQENVATSLVPVQIAKNRLNVDVSDIWSFKTGPGRSSRSPYYVTKEMAQALNGDNLITDFLLKIPFYKSYLGFKVASQLSKTVLSLMTQMRNVETAAFFSFINGHIGKQASVIDAFRIAFQDVTGKGTVRPEVLKKKLTEYLEYGIFDNSVVAGEVEAVMKDIVSGKYKTTDQFLKFLATNPVFRKATEFYQAADNLWKAYGYEFTKSQLVPAIPIAGITVRDARALGHVVSNTLKDDAVLTWQQLVEQQFKEVFKRTWDPKNLDGTIKTYGEAMREIAARYIRDVYPNYSMVPKIVQNWRRLPLGNFVAFQSEIIRNIYSILTLSTREMSASNPYIRQMGARRFLGFSSVLYGFDQGLSTISSQLSGIDQEFLKKYQRFFGPWFQKNSQLIALSPIKPDGTFVTLDWSKEQPFQSATSAFQVFAKEMFNPDKSNEAMFDRFFKAMFYNFEEKRNGALVQLFEPFLTPSIINEHVMDILPTTVGGRGGKTLDGKKIYDPLNDEDGVVLSKMFNHFVQAINPTTFKQAGELLEAVDNQVNRAAKKYDTTEKVLKLFLGLGWETQDPKLSFTYVISDFSDRLQNADANFRSNALDANKLYNNPNNIVEEFEKLQKNRYREMSRVRDFLDVAEELFTPQEINFEFKDRQGFGNKVMNFLRRDAYSPSNIPATKTTSALRKTLSKLQKTYPDLTFEDIFPRRELIDIRLKWMNTPLGLSDDEVEAYHRSKYGIKEPEIEIPATQESIPTVSEPRVETPPLPVQPAPSQQIAQTSPNTMQTGLTVAEQALLSNEEKMIRLRQRGLV